MCKEFIMNGRNIGGDGPVYIIAEMSANHGGSLRQAKDILYAAKEAGADCIKIQTYTADTMTINCHNPYFQIKDGLWRGKNLYQLYQQAYTPWEWQPELKIEAEKLGMDFLSTPFDKTSVDFLEAMGVVAYKIASFELVDIPLIKYTASKGKPVFLSTGMGSEAEIREAVETIRNEGVSNIVLLKCSSAYPAVSSEMNLATLGYMAHIFQAPVGLSDHSMGAVTAVTAVALGAKIIEKHFCISRKIKSPDSSFSMEKDEFKKMVADIRTCERSIGRVYFGPETQEKGNLSFRRSVFTVKNIKKGDHFTENNLRIIRPGYGLHPRYYKDILGKTAARDLEEGAPLSREMVEKYEVQ